jgi:hypothetical protein
MSKGQQCPTGDSSLGRSESLVVVRGCLMGGVFFGRLFPGGDPSSAGGRRLAGRREVFPLESFLRETMSKGEKCPLGDSFQGRSDL